VSLYPRTYRDAVRKHRCYRTAKQRRQNRKWWRWHLLNYRNDIERVESLHEYDGIMRARQNPQFSMRYSFFLPLLASTWYLVFRQRFGKEYLKTARFIWIFGMPLYIWKGQLGWDHPVAIFLGAVSLLALWHAIGTYNLWKSVPSRSRGISTIRMPFVKGGGGAFQHVILEPLAAAWATSWLVSTMPMGPELDMGSSAVKAFLYISPLAFFLDNLRDMFRDTEINAMIVAEKLREKMSSDMLEAQQMQHEAEAAPAKGPQVVAEPAGRGHGVEPGRQGGLPHVTPAMVMQVQDHLVGSPVWQQLREEGLDDATIRERIAATINHDAEFRQGQALKDASAQMPTALRAMLERGLGEDP